MSNPGSPSGMDAPYPDPPQTIAASSRGITGQKVRIDAGRDAVGRDRIGDEVHAGGLKVVVQQSEGNDGVRRMPPPTVPDLPPHYLSRPDVLDTATSSLLAVGAGKLLGWSDWWAWREPASPR